ncbi:MAG: FAD-dependent oxidoreductase [Rhodobacteraceae bacterium]|nr:FAD-dependent oxidoreductase [Paracoccaceae bacterium]
MTSDRQDSVSDVAVIGAGMAGLACARALVEAGLRVRVLDKGRGIGGRMATRRAQVAGAEMRFDHGAQYVTALDPGFATLLEAAEAAGAAAVWDSSGQRPRYAGVPGMSALPRFLATGLDVRQGVQVQALAPAGGGWTLHAGDAAFTADRVVLTVPAPQAAAILGTDHPFAAALESVEMAPCLTLMAAFPETDAPGMRFRADESHPLAWIARDSSRPGRARPGLSGWVAQAGPAWSAQHLEAPPEETAVAMLPLLADALGLDPAAALHASAHRWRYARVTRPLGAPFLADADAGLWLGGDWCLGPRVESAWQSGQAVAADILSRG